MVYSITLASDVQHSDATLLQIILHLKLLRNNDYHAVCYTTYPYCLFILYVVVCIF